MTTKQDAVEIVNCFTCNQKVAVSDLACVPVCKPCRAAMKEYPDENYCSESVRKLVVTLSEGYARGLENEFGSCLDEVLTESERDLLRKIVES